MNEISPRTRRRAVLVIALFWVGTLGILAVREEMILRTGIEVILQTEPVDPFDPFRGDYVVLSYRFSSLWSMAAASETDSEAQSRRWSDEFNHLSQGFTPGAPVYAILEKSGDHHTAVRLSPFPPPEGSLFLKGWVDRWGHSFLYGIEKFFVPQGRGRILELRRNRGRLDVVVRIDPKGRGVLKEIRIDGKPVDYKNLDKPDRKPMLKPAPGSQNQTPEPGQSGLTEEFK